MTWFRLPLFVWSHYAASILMVLGTPVLAITLVLVVLERTVGIGVFDPTKGGDPLLFQHLFWFYSHPAVYIMILPGMGVISEVISTFSRKRVFGYTAVAFSSVAIAVFGFFVWAHHMFIMGISNYAALVFSLLTMLVAVPSAIKIFNWAFTLYKGSITFETPMLYAFGFMGLFTIGGLTGVFLGATGTDIHLTETYFIVAHFHFVMVGGMLMAFLSGIHFWWPKMTGRMYPEKISQLAAVVTFIGFNFTFFPQFILGTLGMPRRYAAYPPEFQVLNVFSTAGATILGVGYLLPILYLTWSLKYGAIAGNNPWQATGLEWQTQSPPLTENFPEIPIMDHEAYDYEWLERQQEERGSQCRIAPQSPTAQLAEAHHEHPPYQRHHFETVEQQFDATNFAMWLFLLTEIMFFGGLFTAYLIYRNWYYPAFVEASHQLNIGWGTANTAVLIIFELHHGHGRVVRGDAQEGRAGAVPGAHLHSGPGLPRHQDDRVPREVGEAPCSRLPLQRCSRSSILHRIPKSTRSITTSRWRPIWRAKPSMYFFLYFAMTGMHALHMIIGIAILGFMIFRAQAGAYTTGHVTFVENFGLYWHFVDIIWIFLFPLLYLISRY